MVPVDEDLGLNDGDEAGLLADARVAGKTVGGFLNGKVGGEVQARVDSDGGAPLREARACK